MKTLKVGILFLMVCLLAGSAFADDYDNCSSVPLVEAEDAMVGDSEVTVTTVLQSWTSGQVNNPQFYYEFEPVGITPETGFIFYPGGTVSAAAYAPMAREIAKAGFFVALVPMPDCLAIYGIGRADAVINNNPGINTWAIGGHSFGGVAACWYLNDGSEKFANETDISGLVLWASNPAGPMTYTPDKVISIWATDDPLTTEQEILAAAPDLPADTYYVELKGANHTQFGWYGLDNTDYDYLTVSSTTDVLADISRQEQQDLIVSYTVNFLDSLTPNTLNIPAAEAQVTADDGSTWERVSLHGFADINNTDIVALTPYNGNLYALTRNDVSGFELWKTDPAQGWQRIHVQGFTDQNNYYGYLQYFTGFSVPGWYGPETYKFNPNMNIWADMIEFQGHLYVAVSTGHQGSALFGSRGALIWRTDGVAWEPVIGGHEPVAEGTLSAISSCGDTGDVTETAVFTDSTPGWEATANLTSCIIEVESEFTELTHGIAGGDPVPAKRLFKIVSNTENTLTVQQNEDSKTDEITRCDEYLDGGFDLGRPKNNLSGFETGAAYTISCGAHSQGFGDPWNKSIIDFEILNDELFASIGLNYVQGARVMRTSDGLNWEADSPYSFGNIHGIDWNTGLDLDVCPDQDGKYTTRDVPVSSSATKMVKTSVAGQETLFIGGTGTAGCNGRGARIYRREGDVEAAALGRRWTPIVDVLVDENAEGTNENGFGYDSANPNTGDPDFFYSAFQAWSWAEYDNNLLVGVAKLEAGGMIYSTPGSLVEEDGAWAFSVGGQSADRLPDSETGIADSSPDPTFNGFGDALNTGMYLYNYNDTVYAGTMVTNLSSYTANPLNGADLWKGTGDGDNISWSRVVGDGFGDATVLQFQAFADYAAKMYMVASTVNPSDFPGQEPDNATGSLVYRLAEEAPECLVDSDCSVGEECVEGVCEAIPDASPTITAGPYLAAGRWPVLPTTSSSESPMYLHQNYNVLWFFSDDYASCPGEPCTHIAEYQAVDAAGWTTLSVTSDDDQGYAFVALPVESLINASTYAFRFLVTDCVDQSAQSQTYYFRVAVTDAPPVIENGPFLAAGTWPMLPRAESNAFVLNKNYNVLWTFSDDYASCSGDCTHRARYRKLGEEEWTWLTPSEGLFGETSYASVTLPIVSSSLTAGTYMFRFDVADCVSQYTYAPSYYYFKVE